MISIVYIVSTLKRAGPVIQLYNIIKYLDRNIFKPHIICLSPEDSSTMQKAYQALNLDIYNLKLSRLEGIFNANQKVKEILLDIKPDIIHTQGIRADILSVGLKNYPVRFATQRNYPYYDYPQKYGPFVGYLMALFHYRALRKIPYLIACSKTISDINHRHGLKSGYIQNGVDLDHFDSSRSCEKRDEVRNKLGIPNEATVFLSVGALIKRKRPEVIIEAFRNAERKENDILTFIGTGPLASRCKDLASPMHNVWFAGEKNNVRDYLVAADCFISASQAEGLPNTVIEALAMGKYVILSDIPSHKEILDINENAGTLFELDNCEQVSALIKDFHYNAESSLAAVNIVKEKLNASKMSALYQEKYLEALKINDGGNTFEL